MGRQTRKDYWTVGTLGILLFMSGCGGGGSSTTAATNSSGEVLSSLTSGYSVPSTISAVPEDTTSASFLSRINSLASAVTPPPLAASTDYAKAVPSKYIEEPVLNQFSIIEQVLGALNQTHFADTSNINNGPYKAMVAWTDEKDGREIKTLQPWVVDSRMIILNGQDVNRVLCWIMESGQTIKAEFKVYSSATFAADGSVTNYGKWDLNVKFNASGTNFFAASASPDSNGGTIIKINNFEDNGGGETFTVKGVLHRDNNNGYGRLEYTDWDSINWATCGQSCAPSTASANYAYDSKYLAVQKNNDQVQYKQRLVKVNMTHNYGLFYDENSAQPGENVIKNKNFGFPVKYVDGSGNTMYAYYGAWQGRHQLWGGSQSGVPTGTTVTKESWGSNAAAVDYTVAAPLKGSFTKRTYQSANLSDIANMPVEIWTDRNLDLLYNGTTSKWEYCQNGWEDWSTYPPVCKDFSGGTPPRVEYTDQMKADELVLSSLADRKSINIDQNGTQHIYLSGIDSQADQTNYSGIGFYPSANVTDANGNTITVRDTAATIYAPNTNDLIHINIGGSIFIACLFNSSGTYIGWVEKYVTSFNTQTYQPEFDDNKDKTFTPELNREYYMNASGINYVVKRTTASGSLLASDYTTNIELQKTANPNICNTTACTDILPATYAYLQTPWDPNTQYDLITDPNTLDNQGASAYLLVVYKTDDPNTTSVDEGALYNSNTPVVATSGIWGLQAYDSTGGTLTTEYNWEYCDPSTGGCWGSQTYLKDSNNAYITLDDPIMLSSAQYDATTGDGTPTTTPSLTLQYDGWLHGMPDLYQDLQQNGWLMSPDIKSKIINITPGAPATDGTNGYYLKPLQTSIFLDPITSSDITAASGTPPSLTQAAAIDLATEVPTFVEHNMGAMPTGTTIKYSEGVAVQ